MKLRVLMGVDWWAEPMEQPADRTTLAEYDVDDQVLRRWREARNEYLGARAALVGQLERQGWRAPADVDAIMRAIGGRHEAPVAGCNCGACYRIRRSNATRRDAVTP